MARAIKLLLPLLACTQAAGAPYYGSKSSEAVYRFSGEVELTRWAAPDPEQAERAVEHQLQHLFGPWSVTPAKAVPKGQHEIHIESISLRTPGTQVIKYRYTGRILLESVRGLTDQPTGIHEAFLPVNPDTIYDTSLTGAKNPCTDPHYNGEGDFWYFWAPAPHNPRCKLVEGRDYLRIQGAFTRDENTQTSYPEYHRLADARTGAIDISLFFGMDDPASNANPDKSRDLSASNYLEARAGLRRMGYAVERLEGAEQLKLVRDPEVFSTGHTLERLTKSTSRGEVRIHMFFGQTGSDEQSRAFRLYYKRALEKSAVLIYNGHSGLGSHLSIPTIESLEGLDVDLPRGKYQIYFFNSCSSYTYYNRSYFNRKRSTDDRLGTKNLDILTNGLATYFELENETDLALLRAIDSWAERGTWTSYQQLAKRIDSDNLFGVNGDEDNPKAPVRD